jgi:hypothetical protein
MAAVGIILALVAGWLDWSWWLAIPIGVVLFLGMAQVHSDRAARIASSAWVTSPLMALFFIWLGGVVHRWIG